MLEVSIYNFKVTPTSSFVKFSLEDVISIFFKNFKVIVIVACKALECNKCPHIALPHKHEQLKKCQIRGQNTWVVIFTNVWQL
jgi:hypothetical protein